MIPLLRFQPISDELQQRSEFDIMLLESSAGEGRQSLQPGRVRRAAHRAPAHAQRLQKAITQHVQRQRRKVLQRFHYRPDQIVIGLYLKCKVFFNVQFTVLDSALP